MIPTLAPNLRGSAECSNCNKRVKCFTITGVAGVTVGWLVDHGCPAPWGGSPTVPVVSPGVEPCDFNQSEHGSTTVIEICAATAPVQERGDRSESFR